MTAFEDRPLIQANTEANIEANTEANVEADAEASAQEVFRAALSLWASGVAIVTTLDARERRWGFTASAFSSVSLDPPLVLVCLSSAADCHEAFVSGATFAVNVLRDQHRQLASQFATKAFDKF